MRKNLILKKWFKNGSKEQKTLFLYLYCFGLFKYFWRIKNKKKSFFFLLNKFKLFFYNFLNIINYKFCFFFISKIIKFLPKTNFYIPLYNLIDSKHKLAFFFYSENLNNKSIYYASKYLKLLTLNNKNNGINFLYNDLTMPKNIQQNELNFTGLILKKYFDITKPKKCNFYFFEFILNIELLFLLEAKFLFYLLILNNKFFLKRKKLQN